MKKQNLNEELTRMREMMGVGGDQPAPMKKRTEIGGSVSLSNKKNMELNGRSLDTTKAELNSHRMGEMSVSGLRYADSGEMLTPEECEEVLTQYNDLFTDILGQAGDDQQSDRFDAYWGG